MAQRVTLTPANLYKYLASVCKKLKLGSFEVGK